MRVELDNGETIDLGVVETAPTIGITDYSRRVTDDFGVTTVVERGFARRMSVRLSLPTSNVDAVQRRLADLRATAALWIADDRFASLQVRGFYKDFAIDVNYPPQSVATLTIEGLAAAEPFTDSGIDPAPDGRASTLQLLQPVTVTGATLVASNVDETDAAEWSAGMTYPKGARVIKAATHRIYESAVAGNVGNDPAGTSGKWIDAGATNRWRMFDEALGSATERAGLIDVTLAAGGANALALLDVVGSSVRVMADGYDRTLTPNGQPGSTLFLDLPPTGHVHVLVAGPGTVSVGTLLIGQLRGLGITEASPSAGITDYSRKDVDEFGAVTVVERAWAKRMGLRSLIRSDAVDLVQERIASVRARPSLWIGSDGLDTLTVYGFFKDFSAVLGENVSTVSLSIEGLSAAAKVGPLSLSTDWADLTDRTGTKPEPNATNSADPDSKLGGITVREALLRLAAIEQDAADLLLVFGETDAAAASAEAARLAKESAQGAAAVATEKANAAATYSALSVRGPSRIQNPNFTLWPDGQALPTNWTPWVTENGSTITRIAGVNGSPYAARMVAPAGAQAGQVQAVTAGFGAWVVEVTIRADNVSGAGLFLNFADANYIAVEGQGKVLSLLDKPDTSGWAGQPGGGSDGHLRTFSWYVETPIWGNIVTCFVYAMANWVGFNVPMLAKTIDFHELRMRPATEAEIAQHDPINGLGSKASITKAEEVAVDAAGNALTTARYEYEAKFSGAVGSILNDRIQQRLTQQQVDARAIEAINTAAGPAGAIGQRLSAVEAGTGGNLVINSELITIDGWGFDPRGTAATFAGINAPDDNWHPVSINAMAIHQVGGDPNQFSHFYSQLMPVVPGEFYQASLVCNSHRCAVELYAHHYATPSAGDGGPPSISGQLTIDNGNGQNLGAYATVSFNFQARTNYIMLTPMKWGTRPGEVDSWAWFLRPQLVRIPSINAPLQPYRPSANLATSRSTQVALSNAQGRLAAYFKIEAIAGNDIASVTVFADNGAGGVRSGVLLGGNVFINGNLTVSGSINTDALADHAVNGVSGASAGSVDLSPNLQDILILPVVSTGRPLMVTASGMASTYEMASVELFRDGFGNVATSAGRAGASVTMTQRLDLPAGTYVFRLRAGAPAPSSGGQPSPDQPQLPVGYIGYPALIVQEIKK